MGRMASVMTRQVQVLIDRRMASGDIGALIKDRARASLADLQSRGLVPPVVTTFVDGRPNADEASVNLRGGTIEYVFERAGEAVVYVFNYCRQLSPYRSGKFYHAWIVVVDGAVWAGDLQDIPSDARQVLVTNPAPYFERLEQHFGRRNPAYHITEMAASAAKRQFPRLSIQRRFVSIPGGAANGWQVPYIRKRPPGGVVLYPAVEITRRAA